MIISIRRLYKEAIISYDWNRLVSDMFTVNQVQLIDLLI